jgi:hypothetical protein
MNLTKISYYARTAINIFLALAFLYVMALVLKNPIRTGLKSVLPEKDPPKPVYGKLSPLEFIAQPVSGAIESYELNTPDGRLPGDFPKKMTVYKYIPNFLSFEAGKEAQEDALALGFGSSELISDFKADKYIWRDISYNSMLTIDLLTESIVLTTPYTSIGSNYPLGSIDEEKALKQAETLLDSVGKMKDQLYLQGTKEIVYGRFLGGKVVEATTPLEAQIAQIDYFRSVNDYPILGPDPKKPLIRLVIGQPGEAVNLKLKNPVVEIAEWEVDTVPEASYPIIPINVAWNNVAQGNGVIANVTRGNQSPFEEYQRTAIEKVFIDKIYLAYYDNIKPQEYLQPIYVFEGRYTNVSGDRGAITIYYPAVDGSYIKGTNETEPQEESQNAPQTPNQPQQ